MPEITEEVWGPWVEHDGRGCPLEVMGRTIEVYFRPEDGADDNWRFAVLFIDDENASCSSWWAAKYEGSGVFQYWDGEVYERGPYWVDRYRIRHLASMTLLQRLVESPQPVDRETEGA